MEKDFGFNADCELKSSQDTEIRVNKANIIIRRP